MMKTAFLGAIAIVSCVGLAAPPAEAVVLNFTTNTNAQTAGAAAIVLDLNTAAGAQTQLNFFAGASSLVIISFDAECAVSGATTANWANIDIQVDPAPLGGGFSSIVPTAGVDDAFCTSNGTAANDGWVNPSRSVVTRVPAGVSAVRVLLNAVNGAGPARIDDLSLIVSN